MRIHHVKDVQFCTKCSISNQRPSSVVEYGNKAKKSTIFFDDKGVCSACRYHEIKYNEIQWLDREKELVSLLDKHRSNDGSYDVIVPSSGGKDSLYVAHILKYKFGMNPLTVTWAPHAYTDIGYLNFQKNVDSGFDNVLITPNRRVHRKLTQLAFKNLLHPFQPFMIGQKNVAPRVALEKNVKLIMYGESPIEGGTPLDINSPIMPIDFFSKPKSEMESVFISGVHCKVFQKYNINKQDLISYMPVVSEDIKDRGIEVHYMSYYKLWIPQENYYYAVDNCGFRPNYSRSEGTYSKYISLDDKIDGFHFYTLYIKYGLGRCSYEAAQEVRNGHITRDEAVVLIRKYDGEFPEKYFQFFLEYIDISKEDFFRIIDEGRSPHLWDFSDGKFMLKHKIT